MPPLGGDSQSATLEPSALADGPAPEAVKSAATLGTPSCRFVSVSA